MRRLPRARPRPVTEANVYRSRNNASVIPFLRGTFKGGAEREERRRNMARSNRMASPLLVIGLGVGVAILGAAVDALWLLIVAALLVVAGGALFYASMQRV